MTIGLRLFRDREEHRLDRLLSQPFRSPQEREVAADRSVPAGARDAADWVQPRQS